MIEEIVLYEALEQRKFKLGEVKFAKSELNDPHIKRVIDALVAAGATTREAMEKTIAEKMAKFAPMVNLAPMLYATIKDNLAEDVVFSTFWEAKAPVDSGAPQFKERTFFKLVRLIAAEHDEFWPLRSYIDGRKLQPKFEFVGGQAGTSNPQYKSVDTAAATPSGVFIFNVGFMQKLLDYAALKQIQPNGKKYVSNGGDIPDGYAYIEFLILHEFMHYTNDDFHYQKVIPNANPMIINWVGDFRSNYLLVKSGYEQLPIGLYNDHINYDRQTSYIQMYELVKAEMEKLRENNPSLADEIAKAMDEKGDDHQPGTKEGESQSADGMTEGDIDKAGKRTEEEMKEGKDLSPGEGGEKPSPGGKPNGSPGSGGTNGNIDNDYKTFKPAFNWKTLIGRMISKASSTTQETFSKPSRRSVSSMEVARQVGAAAIKPGEKPSDFSEIKLAFCIDSSGSMGDVIGAVMANVAKLLKTPQFAKSEVVISKFSSGHDMYKVNFSKNKAGKVASFKDKPTDYTLTVDSVLATHFGAGTTLSASLTDELEGMLRNKYNVVLISDSDIIAGSNITNLLRLIKTSPANMFVIFASASDYNQFRQKAGISTPNITYFK